jgi:hypothetical protein
LFEFSFTSGYNTINQGLNTVNQGINQGYNTINNGYNQLQQQGGYNTGTNAFNLDLCLSWWNVNFAIFWADKNY